MFQRQLIHWVVILAVALPAARAASVAPNPGELKKAELIAAIDAIAEAALQDGPLAGLSIGVAQGSEILLAKGYGFAHLEHSVPATAETVYRLGSITKQFTAVLILQLVEEGKLRLEDELANYLADFPLQGHRVTLHQLLTHTSGIKSYTGLGAKFWREASRLDLTHEQLLALIKDEPFDFSPGEEWFYNNSGYYLLGLVIEKVTGKSYAEVLRERIFAPLGMTASSYCDERAIVRHRAAGYTRTPKGLVNAEPLSMTSPYSAGALCSTVLDLLKWRRALTENRLISRNSYELMTRPTTLADGTSVVYGYGLIMSKLETVPSITHGGGINGFQTQLAYYPAADLTIVVLVNTAGARPNPARIERRIARAVLGLSEPQAKDLPLSSAERARYGGTYKLVGRVRLGPPQFQIVEKEGKLRVVMGEESYGLLYQGDHTFVADYDPDLRYTFRVEGAEANEVLFGQFGFRARRVK